MQLSIIKYYHNSKGINDLLVVSVMAGFLTMAVFTGKTAMRRAKTWMNKFNAGLNPND